jgi:hypothetical protein
MELSSTIEGMEGTVTTWQSSPVATVNGGLMGSGIAASTNRHGTARVRDRVKLTADPRNLVELSDRNRRGVGISYENLQGGV